VIDRDLSLSLHSGHGACHVDRSAEFLREAGKLGDKMTLLFVPNLDLIDALGERFHHSDVYDVPTVLESSLYDHDALSYENLKGVPAMQHR